MAAFPPMTILTRKKHALPKIATGNYSNRGLLALLAHSTNYHVRRRLACCALILFASRCSSASCCVGCAPVKVRFLCMRTTSGRGPCEEAWECEPMTGAAEAYSDSNWANLGCRESHRISGGSIGSKPKVWQRWLLRASSMPSSGRGATQKPSCNQMAETKPTRGCKKE